jgi:hypothetical protein
VKKKSSYNIQHKIQGMIYFLQYLHWQNNIQFLVTIYKIAFLRFVIIWLVQEYVFIFNIL